MSFSKENFYVSTKNNYEIFTLNQGFKSQNIILVWECVIISRL